MSDDLFEKIIDDCTRFPLAAVEPFLQGEPFSDPKLIERLELIRRRLPRAELRLYTNGIALTPKRIDRLAQVGVDHLFISLNSLDPAEYERVLGVPLRFALRGVQTLAKHPQRSRIARKLTLRMTRLPTTTLAQQREFVAFARSCGARPFIAGLYNYKGDIQSPLPVPDFACANVTRVDIMSSGVVTLCCMDHEGEYAWGDVRQQSVLEVYNSPVARRFRELHRVGKRRECEPCNTCNYCSPEYDGMTLQQKARTFVEYGTYLLRHRPRGMAAPAAG
jgi:radical SAM protein with 4Fe4S-binding SPASM domain